MQNYTLFQTCDPAAELPTKVLLGCKIQNVDTCLRIKGMNKNTESKK